MRDMVIHRDDHVIALNKPPGLAVQAAPAPSGISTACSMPCS